MAKMNKVEFLSPVETTKITTTDASSTSTFNGNVDVKSKLTVEDNATFKKAVDIVGDVNITGDLVVSGEGVISQLENVVTPENTITLREGATVSLNANEYTGIIAEKYDGSNNGMLVFDKTGTAYVGDEGNVQPLATRNLTNDNKVVKWDKDNLTLVESNIVTGDNGSVAVNQGIATGNYAIASGTTDKSFFSSIVGSVASALISSVEAPKANGALSISIGNNNKSEAAASITLGASNIAGIHGYSWTSIDFSTNTITLDTSPTDWAVGDYVTIVNGDVYAMCTTIKSVDKTNKKIVVNSLPFTSNFYTISNIAKPAYSLPYKQTIYAINITESNDSNATSRYVLRSGNSSVILGAGAYVSGAKNVGGGTLSNASGFNTLAGGNFDHAEGNNTVAAGGCSHAEGKNTWTGAYAAHAEGQITKASGQAAHAEGYETVANRLGAHAEGYQTRAGQEDGSTNKYKGSYSHAEGQNTKAYGYSAHAEGKDTLATGEAAHASGIGTKATADAQTVVGKYNVESTDKAFIVGVGESSSNPSDGFSVDWYGTGTFKGDVFSGTNKLSTEAYVKTYVDSSYTIAGKKSGTTLGSYSTAEGRETSAPGSYSHAEGYGTVAGKGVTTKEDGSTDWGSDYAHAEGQNTQALGYSSHTEGKDTIAEATASHAGGIGTRAKINAQTVIGKYNKDNSNALFIIGNGSSDSENDRKNLFEVTTNEGVKYDGKHVITATKESTVVSTQTPTTTQYRYYKVQVDKNGVPYVNVPWSSGSGYGYASTTSGGIVKAGSAYSSSANNYGVSVNSSDGKMYVALPTQYSMSYSGGVLTIS